MSSNKDLYNIRRKPKDIPRKVVKNLLSPAETFLAMETSAGILLIITTVLAMIWANSPFYHSYEHMLHMTVGLQLGSTMISKSLHHWVNDGLMVIFFFLVGLEIKRELIVGELSSPKKAALPMFAAIGGMIVPALIYTIFNHDGIGKSGWGIPMATDIAFAVGILTLMSRKCPLALKIFLLALAIVDDLGAVLVIAIFYTEKIASEPLGLSIVGILLTVFIKHAGIRKIAVYVPLGIFVWFTILKSGVHATVAGVVLGLITPVSPLYDLAKVPDRLRELLGNITNGFTKANHEYQDLDHATFHALEDLDETATEARSPLDRLIHMLHPWVSFVIMPIFALFNAGVHVDSSFSFGSLFAEPIAIGVILGLLVGKPIGVLLFSALAIKLNWAQLPKGVNWLQMTAVGFLAGIGFTMALFVGHLALKVPEVEMYSKLGILVASGLAGTIGTILLAMSKDVNEGPAAST